MNFMNLPEEYANKDAKAIIIPIPYEGKMSWSQGASKGPEKIIIASQELEYYDMDLDSEPFEEGIYLTEEVRSSHEKEDEAIPEISEKLKTILSENKNRFFIALGGDHSTTYAITSALDKIKTDKDDEYSVIVFDAHSDLRFSWNDSTMNHACVSHNISKQHEMALIGIRAMDSSEREFLQSEEGRNVHMINAKEYAHEGLGKLKDILPQLKSKVFISIDIDFFDPSFIRNTGTPEPGGLFWNDMISALELIFNEKNVIGADIVEFSPKENNNYDAESYALAKLAYKMIGLSKAKE